ncbi:hypothetical protein A2291_03070 [candidate division WOR-1 bacterium RIFOXYB2_FULL_42_35]|uniref:Aminotransferase DegT n=1 Tax=candidate division WOR-1 bacterium RIFOXYC2_FULL_41_25 TaxID=1802586 RepID=A0A1F4TRA3_UNCSA|nr:MAG: hypothetical protein A2247_01380 [candidate division WOR-1 bacterium RIFOXYA2_FULL_41_14]OGC25727.1 MAG: hypothetical protein A2291_03070 [candidate division WOR-1 bacterium RIFOXYB2_FULL_42_35]OGC35129.1 MAG: hypothetical protein A2462_06215 [candidate division WOR-1 bacterium RIFOXYC2_FULL_41_25]OGC42196.1 MAG: hypothetical protein A2548_03550 [candidate division WOR-1 bacterium RIFOXYD2_FULL_41_8]
MKNIPLLRLDYSDEDIDYIQKGILDVIKSGYLTMGKKVEEFEAEFAKYIGTKYAVAVNSGTSSLEIMLRSFGVKGKTVIVPTVTFMATPISVIHAGGKVAFVDVTKEDLSIDPEDLKRKIAPDTAGVIIVHIGGIISSHYQEIEKICKDMGLFLIEDAAHAHGSSLNGVKAGALSIGGSFSFYPTKILTTAEGGMITTNDENIYKMALTLREHGKPDHNVNVHTEFGYNWRFSEIHALLGLQQMRKVDYIIAERRRLAKLYDKKLANLKGIKLLPFPKEMQCAYYKYILYLDDKFDRAVVKRTMREKFGVALPGEVYSDACHSQPVFQRYPDTMVNAEGDLFPNADYVCSRQICLPLYPSLKDDELDYIADSLKKVLS